MKRTVTARAREYSTKVDEVMKSYFRWMKFLQLVPQVREVWKNIEIKARQKNLGLSAQFYEFKDLLRLMDKNHKTLEKRFGNANKSFLESLKGLTVNELGEIKKYMDFEKLIPFANAQMKIMSRLEKDAAKLMDSLERLDSAFKAEIEKATIRKSSVAIKQLPTINDSNGTKRNGKH